MARKSRKWVGRVLGVLGVLVLAALVAGGAAWWQLRSWTPPRDAFPVQGVEWGMADGPANWRALAANGADFAYLDASNGAFARDRAFARHLAAAREAGLAVGAVHRFDPCQPADPQAGNFATIVPRDGELLPPVVELAETQDNCPQTLSDAAVESELTTLLNQIETHAGKPAILKLSQRAEAHFAIATRIERDLWLTRTYSQPDYAGRPWTLWTANPYRAYEGGEGTVRWVAARE